MRRLAVLTMIVVIFGIGLAWLSETMSAQNRAAAGSLAGSITADRGAVRALRVKATDTVHKIAYTVYTTKGRYHIHNLPPSTYTVQVVEEEFDSPTENVTVAAGQTQTANLSLKFKQVIVQGAGARGAAGQENYGASRVAADGSLVELVDFDQLYPPSPTRDLMVKECFPCHGPTGWHRTAPRNEAGWRRAVDRMFTLDARVAGLAEGQPMVTPSRVSAAQKEEIIKYFATHFGPSYKPRDLKTDALLRDEAALSQAIFIQYEVPPVDGKPFAPGGNGGPPRRSLHSAFASPFTPGLVFMSGNFSGSIVAVDTKNLDFAKRTREWRIDTPNNINVTPHGIYEHTDGLVYFTELAGDRIDALDPKTGKIDRFRIPTEGGGPHSLWLDSKGNVWFTYFAAAGKLARLDAKTRQVKEWEIPDFSGYGVVVDKQDRPWVVGLNSPVVLGYDAKSDKWTTYKISHPARRVTVDAKGNVWACEYYGNKIAMINPTTGTVTEYELPLKYGNPYDLWPDADDNIWVENAVYNSLVKFDQRTKQFTYFPFPDLGAHTPKLDRDKEGTLWFTLGRPSGLAAFKPKGNVS